MMPPCCEGRVGDKKSGQEHHDPSLPILRAFAAVVVSGPRVAPLFSSRGTKRRIECNAGAAGPQDCPSDDPIFVCFIGIDLTAVGLNLIGGRCGTAGMHLPAAGCEEVTLYCLGWSLGRQGLRTAV